MSVERYLSLLETYLSLMTIFSKKDQLSGEKARNGIKLSFIPAVHISIIVVSELYFILYRFIDFSEGQRDEKVGQV